MPLAAGFSSAMSNNVCPVSPQDDLRIALNQGDRLLESINEPLVQDPDYSMNQDELENLATVQRC